MEQAEQTTSRVLRKRKTLMPEKNRNKRNRRVGMTSRTMLSLPYSDNTSLEQIEAYYLNKKVKSDFQSLETIYEEPKTDENDAASLFGIRKIKRLLTFQSGTKEKIKKRRAKIKKLFGNKSFLNRKKIPMHTFLKTFECLELDEPAPLELDMTDFYDDDYDDLDTDSDEELEGGDGDGDDSGNGES